MRIHIIGVATTFMTGLAVLARQAGHEVTASDSCINGMTRRTLEAIDVKLYEGFHVENIAYKPDFVIVASEVSSTNQELIETNRLFIPHNSGSEWLEKYILNDKKQTDLDGTVSSEIKQKSHNPHIPEKTIKHAPKISIDPHQKPKRITR